MSLFNKRTHWLRALKGPLATVMLFSALFSSMARAQSPGPREFLNTPVDQALLWVDYVGATSESVDADIGLPNNESVSQVIAPSFLMSFPLDKKYAGISLTVPYTKVAVSGPGGNLEKWGFTDPAVAFHKNIFGLPALRRDQIGEWVPKTFLSFHFTANLPLGTYNPNSPVNTGANRWAFTPLLNLNIPLQRAQAWLEVYGWVRFFTNNKQFQGNNLLSQHPTGTVGVWYSHNLGKKMWIAAGEYYDYGGETYINHVSQHDTANGFRSSLGISRKFGKFSATLRYENTASKPKASPTSGLLLLRVSVPPLFQF